VGRGRRRCGCRGRPPAREERVQQRERRGKASSVNSVGQGVKARSGPRHFYLLLLKALPSFGTSPLVPAQPTDIVTD
jgi:hypothetical protein